MLLCPWNFSGKNTEVGYHLLFQGIFLTQGSNPHLLHCRRCWATREDRDAYAHTYIDRCLFGLNILHQVFSAAHADSALSTHTLF